MTAVHAHHASPEAALATTRTLIAAAAAADGTPPVSDQAVVAASQGNRALTLFADTADLPIAAGIVGEGELDLVVHPEARNRGVGTAALATLLEQADGAHQAEGPGQAALLAWAHGVNPAAEALLTRAGFAPVRSLYRMDLDPQRLADPRPDPRAAAHAAGLTLAPFAGGNDAADWVRVNAAAFASHPEQGRLTEADVALVQAEPWFDPQDLLLLRDATGTLVGSAWVKTIREGGSVSTELYAVGVDPARAGQGLGRLLLNAALARMAEHDPSAVSLYVDGENERAVRMYETAGFTIGSRSRQWARPATDDVDARMNL